MNASDEALELAAKTWAKRQLLAELRELAQIGHACNVQTWGPGGRKTNAALCAARRRAAAKLLKMAIAAVLNSGEAR